jgi:BioD-like phosphotransacetylase family protein
MKNLFIMGTAGSGKTRAAVGLALKFRQEGYRVGYFKPVGNAGTVASRMDEDGLLMKEILQMEQPIETIVPYQVGPAYLSNYRNPCKSLSEIRKAYEAVAEDKELVIIGGTGFPHIMGCLGLDAVSLALEFNALPLFTISITDDFSIDQAVFINSFLACKGLNIVGNVFHNVPLPLLAKTEGIYRPILEERGFKTLGIIPESQEITSPTVKEYFEVLGGEVIAAKEKMDRVVEDVIIGAMSIESALGYLRRTANKAVITGGDRSDVALAALETNTSALILTGGLYPDVKVAARAEDLGVPVILVHYDTYTTIEKASEITRKIRANDEKAIKAAVSDVEKHVDWRNVLKLLQ